MLFGLLFLLFLAGCVPSISEIQSRLETCLRTDYLEINQCFYEVMDNAEPEQVFTACTTLEKKSEYNFVEPCYAVLIDKFRPEALLPQLLASCEKRAPLCTNTVLGSYGNIEKCTQLQNGFNITVDGQIRFPFYDDCINLARAAPARRTVFEALAQKKPELCKELDKPNANVCLFRLAKRTGNLGLCNDIVPLTDEKFTLREFCTCASQPEPTILCYTKWLPGYTKNLTSNCRVVKNGKLLAQVNLTENEATQLRDLEMRYAPCTTQFKYSAERTKYNQSII